MRRARLGHLFAKSRAGSPLIHLLLFLLYWGIVLAIQRAAGATSTSFGFMPDEPAHYLSAVMVHDYLRHGLTVSPIKFATTYYVHLPYFAVGYWPPFFYVITALWMFVFGCARDSVLVVTALVAAALCFTTFRISARWLSVGPAFVIGLLPLLVPEVLWQSCFLMVDLPVALFSLWAALAFERFLATPEKLLPPILFSLCASGAILAKYNGVFICLLPIGVILVLRRWDLLRRGTLWLQPILIAALCAPWVLSTRSLASYGLPGDITSQRFLFLHHLVDFVQAAWRVVGWEICLGSALAFGLILFLKPLLRPTAWVLAAVPSSLIVFLAASPVGPEGRYFIPAVAPCCILIGLGWHVINSQTSTRGGQVFAGLVVAAVLLQGYKIWRSFPHLARDEYAQLADNILAKPEWRSSLFLAPEQGEGSFIAELAMRDPRRPSLLVARPKKILADMDWLGFSKHLHYTTVSALQSFFDQSPIDYVIVRQDALAAQSELGRLIIATISKNQNRWQEVSRVPSHCSDPCAPWQVFHRLPLSIQTTVPDRLDWLAQREFSRLHDRRPNLPVP